VVGNDFLNRTLVAQEIRERVNKKDCFKLKRLLHRKGSNSWSEKRYYRMGAESAYIYPKYIENSKN
jgi:hypothetical protein